MAASSDKVDVSSHAGERLAAAAVAAHADRPPSTPAALREESRHNESNRADASVDAERPCACCGHPLLSIPGADKCSKCGWAAGAPYVSGPARLGVLRNIHFRRVWCASLVSNTGNWMEMLAVQMMVAHQTGSLKMAGYLGAAQLTPMLLFGLLGGLIADRVERRRLLVVTQILLMLIAAAFATVSALGVAHVSVLLVISALQGTVMAFNTPAWQVMTPRLVPRADLTKAITLQGIQFNASRVLGPALAGVLLGWCGATPVFIFNTISFMGVVAAVWRTPISPAPARHAVKATSDRDPQVPSWLRAILQWLLALVAYVRREFGEAAAFLFGTKGPLCVLLATILMSLFAAPLIRMLPLYVIDVYGMKGSAADDATGWFLAVQGMGAVLGGLALKFLPAWYPKHHFIPMAVTGAGLTISLFALTRAPWIGYGAMFFVGVFWIWAFNQSWAALQHLVIDRMRGRVMSIAVVAAFGATAIGNVAAGWMGETVADHWHDRALGTHLAVGGFSALLLIAGLVMLVWRVPEVDGMPSQGGPRDWNLLRAVLASEHRPGKRSPSVLDDPSQTIEEHEPA